MSFTNAGPLLLNALLKYLGQSRDRQHHDEQVLDRPGNQVPGSALQAFLDRDSLSYGCCLVAMHLLL
jgi:hypothetical protein